MKQEEENTFNVIDIFAASIRIRERQKKNYAEKCESRIFE